MNWVSELWLAVNARCAASASTGDFSAAPGEATAHGDVAAAAGVVAAGLIEGAWAGVVAAVGSGFAMGASAFGAAVPDMPAAYAVMCVRTSISFARVAASIATGVPALPVVPAAPAVALAPVVGSLPSISVMILSIAATSVPQFDFAAVPPAGVAVGIAEDDAFSSAARCFFNCANWFRLFAGTEVSVMLSAAAFA